jgi:CO/xanthine dehydrogenase Mo-binding subunit
VLAQRTCSADVDPASAIQLFAPALQQAQSGQRLRRARGHQPHAQTGLAFADGLTFVEDSVTPLQSGDVKYWGQHVAVVIAKTFEAARAAAVRLRITYDEQRAEALIDDRTRTFAELADSFMDRRSTSNAATSMARSQPAR